MHSSNISKIVNPNFLKTKRKKTIFGSITAPGISLIVTRLVLMRNF